jgi:hypothetical protein
MYNFLFRRHLRSASAFIGVIVNLVLVFALAKVTSLLFE